MAENDNLEEKIKRNKEKYEDIVNKLKAKDITAWKSIFQKVVEKAWKAHSPNGYNVGKIAKDILMTKEDIFSELYCLMIAKGKLDLYRYEGDLYNWMIYNYVIKEIVLKKCPRTKEIIDVQTGETSKKRFEVSMDHKHLEDMAESTSVSQEAETDPDKELLMEAVAKLHRQNPLEAYLLLLHGQEGLTFNVICDTLGKPDTPTNCKHYSYVFTRAQENMKKIMQ
jgi:hypothetical protein